MSSFGSRALLLLYLRTEPKPFDRQKQTGDVHDSSNRSIFLRGNVDLLDLLLVMQMASEICPPKRRTTHTTKDILIYRQLHSLYTALFPNRCEKHQELGGAISPNGYPPVSPTPLMRGNKIDSGCLIVRVQQCQFGIQSETQQVLHDDCCESRNDSVSSSPPETPGY